MKNKLLLLALIAVFGCEDSTSEATDDAGSDTTVEGPDATIDTDSPVAVEDRAEGERVGRAMECDPMDAIFCASPWPNNAFAKAADTATGLRVNVLSAAVAPEDALDAINAADGFSTLSTLTVSFEGTLDDASLGGPYGGAMRLFRLPISANSEVPLGLHTETRTFTDGTTQSLLVGHVLRPLDHNADYLAVVTSTLVGQFVERDSMTSVAMSLVAPATDVEEALRAYYAPIRRELAAAEVNITEVVKAWDFTTRSSGDIHALLPEMMAKSVAAVQAGDVSVTLTEVRLPESGPIAAIVMGTLDGLPNFLNEGQVDADGARVYGTASTPFRVLIPAGTGDYRFVMYGHGTGGELDDDAFDADLAELGIGKVSLEWTGWTGGTLPQTAVKIQRLLDGSWRSTSPLLQALGHGAAVQEALSSVLGDVLAANELNGQTNPAAGRRPIMETPIWTGGSMGGTLGFVYTAANPTVKHAVLNVPGAAWTHWIPDSDLYAYFSLILKRNYPTRMDVTHALAMAQILWDPIDGGAYDLPDGFTALLQESIGDPILPNPGTNIVATATHAVLLGAQLLPIVDIEQVTGPVHQTAITQFKVASDDAYSIHGFAARDTPAGAAALSQILAFLQSVWDGTPAIELPVGCSEGSCDFSH